MSYKFKNNWYGKKLIHRSLKDYKNKRWLLMIKDNKEMGC